MEGRETDGESERELSFIPLEDILVYKIICPPSQSPLLFLPARRKKKIFKAVKHLVRLSFLLLKNCPSIPLRTAIKDNSGLI